MLNIHSWPLSFIDRWIGNQERRESWQLANQKAILSDHLGKIGTREKIKNIIFNLMVDQGAAQAKEGADEPIFKMLQTTSKAVDSHAINLAITTFANGVGALIGIDSAFIKPFLDQHKPFLNHQISKLDANYTKELTNIVNSGIEKSGLYLSYGEIYASSLDKAGLIDQMAVKLQKGILQAIEGRSLSINPLKVGPIAAMGNLVSRIASLAIQFFGPFGYFTNDLLFQEINDHLTRQEKPAIGFSDLATKLSLANIAIERYHSRLTTPMQAIGQVKALINRINPFK
jgi:hypothetical protein